MGDQSSWSYSICYSSYYSKMIMIWIHPYPQPDHNSWNTAWAIVNIREFLGRLSRWTDKSVNVYPTYSSMALYLQREFLEKNHNLKNYRVKSKFPFILSTNTFWWVKKCSTNKTHKGPIKEYIFMHFCLVIEHTSFSH